MSIIDAGRTLSVSCTKFLPATSPLVRPFNSVLSAKATNNTSSKLRYGSFWYDDLMYRITIGEPGTRLMVDTRVVREEPRMVSSGRREEGMSDGEEGEEGSVGGMIGDDMVGAM